MKPASFNSNTITLAVVLLLGLLLAIVVGDSVASGRYAYIGLAVLLVVGLPLALKLGTNAWILIALTTTATGRLGFVPLPLSLSEICAFAAILLFGVNVVMRRINLKTPLYWLDVLVLMSIAWLIATFIKNPTGVFFLGSDSVGGRKYFEMGIAFAGYFIFTRSFLPKKWAYHLPVWMAICLAIPWALQALATISPQLGEVIARIYSVQVESDAQMLTSQGAMGTEARVFGLERVALPLFLAMCAYYAPVTFINPLHPVRVLGFLVAFILVGLGGFRSILLTMFGYMAVGTWLRGRIRDFVPLAAVGLIGLIALAGAVQSGVAVPLTIQRALSVLPLGWDPEAMKAAEDSTTWRVDMWRDAWNDPNYFKDKVFGDGFGFTHQELMIFANEMIGKQGLTGVSNTYEMFIIRGSLHNGPLSSIRYAGFVGLFLITALMIGTAIYAFKVAQASLGTVYAPIAFFIAIPLIYEVFSFFVIYGAYEDHLRQYFLGVGMLNMINRSLPQPSTARSDSPATGAQPTPAALTLGIPSPAAHLR
jgi:hypothetical protein